MSGFVKINFDAVDDFDDDASVSPSSADEGFDADEFFMDDSSGDSFVMADDVSFDDTDSVDVVESFVDDFDNDDSNTVGDSDSDSNDGFVYCGSGGGSAVEPLFKKPVSSVLSGSSSLSNSVDDNGGLSFGDERVGGSSEVSSGDVSSSEGLSVVPVSLRRGDVPVPSGVPVNPLLVDDEDELDFSDSSVVSSSSVMGSSSVDGIGSGGLSGEVVNPFLLDNDEDEDAPFLGFDGRGVSSSDTDLIVDDVSSDYVADDVESDLTVGSVSRDEVREVVDGSVSVDEFSVPVEGVLRGGEESSVVVHKRGPRFVESEFRRQNVSEVVVGSGSEKVVKPEKQRYRYVREDGRLNGAELEFFKRLGVSRREGEAEDERLRVLRGRVDGVDTVAARKARNVLYGQAIGADDMLRRGSKMRFSEMDRDVLQFLAKFRYVKDEHLGIAFNRAPSTMYSRLKKLRSQGLVLDKKVYGSRPIWFLTEAGMLLSGFDVARVTEGKMSTMMFPHQFTVNHVAANVWGANVNVLNLENFPLRNRVDAKGVPVFGERLVGEVEIQSSFGRMKMFDKAEVFVPELKANVDRAFEKWEKSGGVSFGESPEFQIGNEYMWALLPPASLRKAYHIPDLVVMRPRNEDGSPESIAVEVEINNKDTESYEKVLRAYRADDRIFKKVVWVCKSIGPARKLETVAKNIGLWQEGKIEILPVITEHGIFKERDMWFI